MDRLRIVERPIWLVGGSLVAVAAVLCFANLDAIGSDGLPYACFSAYDVARHPAIAGPAAAQCAAQADAFVRWARILLICGIGVLGTALAVRLIPTAEEARVRQNLRRAAAIGR